MSINPRQSRSFRHRVPTHSRFWSFWSDLGYSLRIRLRYRSKDQSRGESKARAVLLLPLLLLNLGQSGRRQRVSRTPLRLPEITPYRSLSPAALPVEATRSE